MRNLLVIFMLLAVLALPYALRPKENLIEEADETLVIVSPHTEAIRYEFARGFRAWYKAKTGKTVRFDWRSIGGTSEIGRYVNSEYMGGFQNLWVNELERPWSHDVSTAFNDRKQKPGDDSAKALARKTFLESNVGIGIDLFFGGGSYDFARQAGAGQLVDSGVIDKHPELFGPGGIPQAMSGEEFWSKDKAWIGTCFSAFGIVYNTDSLRRLGFADEEFPDAWADLADPRLYRQVALADPTMSGSAIKAFEMIMQQQMQQELVRLKAETGMDPAAAEKLAIEAGWNRAMSLILRIGANSRYFTDSASKIPMDVASGNAAAGMAIDFYGRFQSEVVQREDGTSRVVYLTPPGGSSVGVDPVGMFRGAPNKEVAVAFIEYCMSPEGQKLWNWKVGEPGGPERYAIRRLPVRPELYAPQYQEFRADPNVFPYEEAKGFTYQGAWTGPYFRSIGFAIKGMCLDNHHELQETWRVLQETGYPAEAMAAFDDLGPASYAEVAAKLRPAMDSPDKIAQVRLARDFTDHFRTHFQHVRDLAEKHRGTLTQGD